MCCYATFLPSGCSNAFPVLCSVECRSADWEPPKDTMTPAAWRLLLACCVMLYCTIRPVRYASVCRLYSACYCADEQFSCSPCFDSRVHCIDFFPPVTAMKTRSAVRLLCKHCKFVRRRGRLFVVCTTTPKVRPTSDHLIHSAAAESVTFWTGTS